MSYAAIILALLAGETRDVPELAGLAEAMVGGSQEVIALGVVDDQAFVELERELGRNLLAPAYVFDLRYPDDAQDELADHMASNGFACGLLAEPREAGGWSVTMVGDCSFEPGGVEVVEEEAGAPTPAPSTTAVAPAAPSLLDDLMALPSHAARLELLGARMGETAGDPDASGRLSQATAVVLGLQRTERSDPSVLRFFLEAALCDDPTLRAQAVQAASSGGDPPRLSAAQVEEVQQTPVTAEAKASLDDAVKAYERDCLWIGDNGVRVQAYIGPYGGWANVTEEWSVYRGRSRYHLDARSFATKMNDRTVLRTLDAEAQRVKKIQPLFYGITGALTVAQIVVAATAGSSSYDAQFGDHPAHFLPALAATPFLSIAIVMPIYYGNKKDEVRSYYTKSHAASKIGRYNNTLRDEHGLTKEDLEEAD